MVVHKKVIATSYDSLFIKPFQKMYWNKSKVIPDFKWGRRGQKYIPGWHAGGKIKVRVNN